jgi:dTDP-4-dehydrorhamnose 3,5-epimerase
MNIKISKFEKHNDDRGQLVVFLKHSDMETDHSSFGQIYFVTFDDKDVIRGNHYHKEWREWFGVVTGKLKVLLKDMKTGETQTMILDGDSDEYTRLEIGPNIAHTFISISKNASLLNYTDKEWNPHDTFSENLI